MSTSYLGNSAANHKHIEPSEVCSSQPRSLHTWLARCCFGARSEKSGTRSSIVAIVGGTGYINVRSMIQGAGYESSKEAIAVAAGSQRRIWRSLGLCSLLLILCLVEYGVDPVCLQSSGLRRCKPNIENGGFLVARIILLTYNEFKGNTSARRHSIQNGMLLSILYHHGFLHFQSEHSCQISHPA